MQHFPGWPSWWRPQRKCPKRRSHDPSAPQMPSAWRTAGRQNYRITDTQRHTQTIGNCSLADGLGQHIAAKPRWLRTQQGMSSRQRQGGGGEERMWTKKQVQCCNKARCMKTERNRGGERGGGSTEMQRREKGHQQELPGGSAGAERRSVRTRKLHFRVKSCSYTNIKRNKSLCENHRKPKQKTP